MKRPEFIETLQAVASKTNGAQWIIEKDTNFGNIYIRERLGAKGRVARIWTERTHTDENAAFICEASPANILELIRYVQILERAFSKISDELQTECLSEAERELFPEAPPTKDKE